MLFTTTACNYKAKVKKTKTYALSLQGGTLISNDKLT